MRTVNTSRVVVRLNWLRWMIIAVALPLLTRSAFAQTNRYVDLRATGAGNGASWSDAFVDLQAALAIAQRGDTVWVAEGVYRPGTPGASRGSTFRLRAGVTLLGGFAGDETDPRNRQVELHPTILSGDLSRNDDPSGGNNNDNCYHVVTIQGGDQTTVLDGFIIAAGNANSVAPDNVGAGLFILGGRPTIRG